MRKRKIKERTIKEHESRKKITTDFVFEFL